MELVEGIYLHGIKTDKFKTSHLTIRFSGDLSRVNKAGRALVAQMLATANQDYPTSQLFRRRLAELYGAQLTTCINTKGLIHMLDIDLSFIDDSFFPADQSLLKEIVGFLESILFRPLLSIEQFQTKTFKIEQTNLIHYLEADKEDLYYSSDVAINKLYFEQSYLQEPKYSTPEKVNQETAYTAYQELNRMLREDRIDIFFVSSKENYDLVKEVQQWPLKPRKVRLSGDSSQDLSNLIKEKFDRRSVSQSILTMLYRTQTVTDDFSYAGFLVLNGMLGAFPHSLLFTEVREKEGLAYSISSQFNPYASLLKIQAGISKFNRHKTLQLMRQQLQVLKTGRFSGQLLTKTKTMIANGLKLSEDSPKSLMEMTYNNQVLGLDLSKLADQVEKISKQELVSIARTIRLQALYFMEGEE